MLMTICDEGHQERKQMFYKHEKALNLAF